MTPYWMKKKGKDKFEDTQLFISKIYSLSVEEKRYGVETRERSRWMGELVLNNCLAYFFILFFFLGEGNPRGQFLIQLGQLDMQHVKSHYRTYLDLRGFRIKFKEGCSPEMCHLHKFSPGSWIQSNYAKASTGWCFKTCTLKKNGVILFWSVTTFSNACQLLFPQPG